MSENNPVLVFLINRYYSNPNDRILAKTFIINKSRGNVEEFLEIGANLKELILATDPLKTRFGPASRKAINTAINLEIKNLFRDSLNIKLPFYGKSRQNKTSSSLQG